MPDPVKPGTQVQSKGESLPSIALAPVEHAMQVEDAVAPVMFEYVPSWHLVHSPEPLDILYVPAGQAVHVPPDPE